MGAAAVGGARWGGKSFAGVGTDTGLTLLARVLVLESSAVNEGLRGRLAEAGGGRFWPLSLLFVCDRFLREGVRGDIEADVLEGGTTGSTDSDGLLGALDSDAFREGLGRLALDDAAGCEEGTGCCVTGGTEVGTFGETEGAFALVSWGDFFPSSDTNVEAPLAFAGLPPFGVPLPPRPLPLPMLRKADPGSAVAGPHPVRGVPDVLRAPAFELAGAGGAGEAMTIR